MKKKTKKSNISKKEKYVIERVQTGIPGLDKLIEGGFVKGSSVLVSGETGTGKTTLCLQFLWEGLRNGEPGVYITFEETAEEIKRDAICYGMNLEEYEKKGLFRIVEKNVFENMNFEFFDVDRLKAKRVVIDSISILSMAIEDKASTRDKLNEVVKSLKERETTLLMVSEAIDSGYSRLGIEEFIADGVISLDFSPAGTGSRRSLFIKKLRRTKHSENIHPIEITKTGIKLKGI